MKIYLRKLCLLEKAFFFFSKKDVPGGGKKCPFPHMHIPKVFRRFNYTIKNEEIQFTEDE